VSGPGPTVLVAEDDGDILALLAMRLGRRGYEVITATDGEQALAAAIDRLPDIAVLDGLMPGLEGHEVCARLRARAETASIPVVLLTAKASEIDRAKALAAGVDDYVLKPFSIDDLDALLKRLLATRSQD
jgi:DNA-binding response OmpR family regulator